MSNRNQINQDGTINKVDGILRISLISYPYLKAIAYLLVVFFAELLIKVGEPQFGLILHSIGLIGLLLYAARQKGIKSSNFWLSLSLAPLTRLISLSIPRSLFPIVYWYMVIGIPLIIAAFMVVHLAKLNWSTIGLVRRNNLIQFLIALTGFEIGFVEYYILRPDPLINEFSWDQLIIPAIIILLFTGFLEELIFRGILQKTASSYLGRFGLLYVALLFAILHIGYTSVMDVIFVFGVGLFFGWVVNRTKSIIGVSAAHGLGNVILYLVLPFLIPK